MRELLKKYIRRNEKVAWRIIDGEAYLVTPSDTTLHALNPVGTRIWEMADGNLTVSDIIDRLFNEFDVDLDTLKEDVFDFIDKLFKLGVLT